MIKELVLEEEERWRYRAGWEELREGPALRKAGGSSKCEILISSPSLHIYSTAQTVSPPFFFLTPLSSGANKLSHISADYIKPLQGSLSLSCCYCNCPPNADALFSVCFLSIAPTVCPQYHLIFMHSCRCKTVRHPCHRYDLVGVRCVEWFWCSIMLSGILARPGDLQLENHVEHPIWAVCLQQLHNVGVLQHVTDAGLPLQIWKHTQKNRDQERKTGRWGHMAVRRAHNSMNVGLTQIILTLRKECLLDIA